MKLILSSETTLAELKSQFSANFPYLKIEFFKKKHAAFEGSVKKDMLESNQKVSQFSNGTVLVDFEFSPSMSVADFESLVTEKTSLSCQVFRKSSNSWIETSRTDDWDLTKQNEEGRIISEGFNESFEQRLENNLLDLE